MNPNKRNFFDWLFFQEPSAGTAPAVSPATHRPPPAQVGDRWVKLSVYLDIMPFDRIMSSFPFAIGRTDTPGGMKIDDKSVEKRHAIIDMQGSVITVTDNNSKSGVYVGTNRIMPGVATPLNRGDVIKIGPANIAVTDFSIGVQMSFNTPPQPAQQPMPPQPVSPRAFCGKCGMKNEAMGNFCNGCGSNLNTGG